MVEELPKDLGLTYRQQPVAVNLKYFDDATRLAIYEDLKKFNWQKIDEQVDAAKALSEESANQTNSELDQFSRSRWFSRSQYNEEELNKNRNAGYLAISRNELCVVTLAGGQASRLGATKPKGLYPLKLGFDEPLKNCLFYLQAAQISCLQKLANGKITWLIMTSQSTDAETKKAFLEIATLAGLKNEQIRFFTQAEMPCLDENGRFLTGKNKVLTAPNGNGGFYDAIGPILPELREAGIKYFHVYCVDNILARVGDPLFIGTCINQNADCAAKSVNKYDPHEKIGIICVDTDVNPDVNYAFQYKNDMFDTFRVRVIEYSEISYDQATQRDIYTADEMLYFRDGNIANHFFCMEFLEYVLNFPLPYHIANKEIKVIDSRIGELTVLGMKLERFIFDAFGYSRNFLIYEVSRDDEFGPLKNNDAAKIDCPTSCVAALQKLHKKWIENANWKVEVFKKKFPEMLNKNDILDPRFTYEDEGIRARTQDVNDVAKDVEKIGLMAA